MKSKYKKCKSKESENLSNVSNAFCFDTQFDFHSNNYNNYKSIFSYKAIDISEDDEEVKETNYCPITIVLGFLMVLFFPVFGWFSLKVIRRNNKLAIFRYGKLLKIVNPGVAFVIPLIDSCKFIDTTIKESRVKSASCPTKDHGLVEIDCVLNYRIMDPTFMIINVRNWTEFIITETRVSLLFVMKHFRWYDFNDSRIAGDLESQILITLNNKVEEKGLEILKVHVENITQKKEPESSLDVLKKINFKDLGRQLTSMTPLFMGSNINSSENSSENENSSSKEKALKEFFEKLEIIKNIAISNLSQQKESEKSVSFSQPPDTEAQLILVKLIKDFVLQNVSIVEIGKIVSQKSLKPLFENTEKVVELSKCIKEITRVYNIQGNILFDVTNYFKYPSYFHYNYEQDKSVLIRKPEDLLTTKYFYKAGFSSPVVMKIKEISKLNLDTLL